jgi:predicted nucleotidyltransferase
MQYHPVPVTQAEIDHGLAFLCASALIYQQNEFYSLHQNPLLIARRRKGNEMAALQMPIAQKAGKILSKFPFVTGVAISGSLSKNFSTEHTDIDFFIITQSNRLWLARTIMHLYKKLTFLTGKQHWFCMNYYVDEACPEIAEKNIFTATELFTLLPVQGNKSFTLFRKANNWVENYFCAFSGKNATVPEISKSWLAKLVEGLLNNQLGEWLDRYLMRITDKRWKKKQMHPYKLAKKGLKGCG